MRKSAARNRLAVVVRSLADEKRRDLDRLKAHAKTALARPDFVWRSLSFSTMGRAAGYGGVIGNQNNYRQLTYHRLATLTAKDRKAHVMTVCHLTGIRWPERKARYLLGCFQRISQLGGHAAAKAKLLNSTGRDAKIKFLESFPGIGPKYARNIMMASFHEEFRDSSIAVDVRINGISKKLGLTFASYKEEEAFYLDVARDAGLNAWELDRLLFTFSAEVKATLKIRANGRRRATSDEAMPNARCLRYR